ncbi:hypothetical protein BH11BAC3_BH11BAC3_35070 [soil metagenome]
MHSTFKKNDQNAKLLKKMNGYDFISCIITGITAVFNNIYKKQAIRKVTLVNEYRKRNG